MKKTFDRPLNHLLYSALALAALVLALALSNPAAVFAADESPEDQYSENIPETETIAPEAPQAETVPSPAAVDPAAAETESAIDEPAAPENEPAIDEPAAPETEPIIAEPAAPETEPDDIPEALPQDIPEAIPETTPTETSEPESIPDINEETDIPEKKEVLGDTYVPEPLSEGPRAADVSGLESYASAAVLSSPAYEAPSGTNSANNSSSGTIRIGDTAFSSDNDETSHWSEAGTGWMNVGGQYLAMVDYDGRETELSSDAGVVTLAVAGLNRIKALKGDCSYQIIGTGIVLIDSIEIEDGRTITLHPNTAVYEEGSAAVFVLQEDGNYLLVNGEVTGILDEDYTLDGVNLVLPNGTCLKLGAMYVRTETWTPEGAKEPVTDVTRYTTEVPQSAGWKTHEDGKVYFYEYAARVVIKENSSITVESGASLQLMEVVSKIQNYYGDELLSELVVKGKLNVEGVIEDGSIDIRDGGTLTGKGTIRSADVSLQTTGNMSGSVLMDNCTVTLYGNDIKRRVPLKIKDSVVSLRESAIDIPDLSVSGSCMLCIDTVYSCYPIFKIGNITFSPEGQLEVLANDHEYVTSTLYWGFPYRLLEDCNLEIYGKISGKGTVNILSGCTRYYGTEMDNLPVVPEGYGSRVLIYNGTETTFAEYPYPLIMTQAEATARAAQDEIPLMGLFIFDTWPYDDGTILARKWVASSPCAFPALSRENDKEITVTKLLQRYGLVTPDGRALSSYYLAVELIYSDLNRSLHYYGESNSLTTENVIMVRILQCYWDGGFGGSSSSHTSTSFIGSGVLGGIGTGSAKTGIGSVVYGKVSEPEPEEPQPEEPKPEEPKPEEPKPEEPKPEEPKPEEPKPEEPQPEEPEPQEPTPQEPTPEKSKPTKTKPTKTKTTVSSPTVAAPADSRINNVNNTTSSRRTERLVVTVVLREQEEDLTEEDLEEETEELPQIWILTVTKGGKPVTDLTNDPVRVVFEFTAPDDWGTPEEIAEETLYAVFADDEGVLTAYEAEYDPETGEVSFDSELTGEFIIVRFSYEDALLADEDGNEPLTDEAVEALIKDEDGNFTEEFYLALADLEEVRDFLEILEEERTQDQDASRSGSLISSSLTPGS